MNWRYRCSICGELIHPDSASAHMQEEKAKPDWPGIMNFKRVDVDAQGNPIDGS